MLSTTNYTLQIELGLVHQTLHNDLNRAAAIFSTNSFCGFDLDAKTQVSQNQINCVADISRYQAKINGHRIAQIFEGRETTYSELDHMANQVANGLIKAACEPGTRIGYIGKNSDYYF
jgi:non-ribosomal peptide synthetase component F